MSNTLTLRDHFAGLAMQGLLANSNMGDAALHDSSEEWLKDITESAYEYADEMIRERNKHLKERHEELCNVSNSGEV